jgi:DNA-binding LytR/AlgR family response regulator
MSKLRVLIADDESPARTKMLRLLSTFDDVEVVNVSSNGQDALDNLRLLRPDLAFLDIEMPGLTGLQVAEQLGEDLPTRIVFATAYNEHAIRAFELHAIDYLLKPFGEERLRQTLDRVSRSDGPSVARVKQSLAELTEPDSAHLNKLPVPTADRFRLIDYNEILSIEVEERCTTIYTRDKSYTLTTTLDALEKKLPANQFVRISRSILVNMHEIKEIVLWFSNRYKIVLSNGREVISSREKSRQLKQLLKF